MDYTLPANMVIKPGDLKGIFAGYFLVTDTNAKKPVVGSTLLSELSNLAYNVSVFHEDSTWLNSVTAWLESYGIDITKFMLYLYANKNKILVAVNDYAVYHDLVQQYEKLAKIQQGHSISEYIDHLGEQAKSGLMGLAGGIGDILSNLAKHLLPILIVIVVLFLVYVYGMKHLNKNK